MNKKVCILLFENYYNTQPGHREATTLQDAGYDVTVLCNTGKHKKTFDVLDNVKVRRVDIEKWQNRWSKLKYFISYLKMTKIAITLNAHIYHCHDLLTIIPGYIAAKANGSRIIYHSNELNLDTIGVLGREFERFIWKLIETALINRVDKVVTLNESIADTLVNRYHLKEYPVIVRNCPRKPKGGIRDNDLLRKKFHLSQQKKIVLYQGGLINGRGLFHLVESVKYFPEDAILIILGDGYLKSDLIQLAKKLHGLNRKIFFHNYVPSDKLLNYTASANVGVITYQCLCLNYYYVLPNKIFEYLMAGLPVIASNFPELKRLVNQFNVGELVDPESPEEIGKAVSKIISDKECYKKMHQNALKASKVYNWKNESKKLLNLYNELK